MIADTSGVNSVPALTQAADVTVGKVGVLPRQATLRTADAATAAQMVGLCHL